MKSLHQKSKRHRGILLCLLLFPFWVQVAAPDATPEGAPEKSVVGLETVSAEVPADRPYATPTFVRRNASGLLVAPGLVLTNLDAVRDSISVKTRLGDVALDSTVRHSGYGAGLALVSFTPPGGSPMKVAAHDAPVPAGARVDVFGYDVQSRSVRLVRLRVTGSVTRLLHNSDVDLRSVLLLDDPPGETGKEFHGGPVFLNGAFLGVYHQGRPSYVLPGHLAAHLLLDAADDTYDGFPDPGFLSQPVTGAAHRSALGLNDDENGVVIRRVLFGSGAWQKLRTGDVLLAVNGMPFSAGGEIASTTGRRSLPSYFAGLQKGSADLVLRRGSQKIDMKIEVASYPGHEWKRRRRRDLRPYLITAGLVFQELDYNLLHLSAAGRESLLRYRYGYFDEDGLAEQVDRDVVLSSVLEDPATNGAKRFRFGIVEYVNQIRIRNLKHLSAELKRSQERFLVLRFLDHGAPLVLERESIGALDARIRARYRVEAGGTVEAAR